MQGSPDRGAKLASNEEAFIAANDRRIDALIYIACICLAVTAYFVGANTRDGRINRDERVYATTIAQMQRGDGYYTAYRTALVEHVGSPPSQVRSVRPPTPFLALRLLPANAPRVTSAIIMLAILIPAARIAGAHGRIPALTAPLLVGPWLVSAAPFLYLHAELLTLAFLFLGFAGLQENRERRAIGWFLAASVIRETAVLAILIGLLQRRSKPWLIALGVWGGLYLVHTQLAYQILSPDGSEAAFGDVPRSLMNVLTWLSPGDRPASWVIGIITVPTGLVMMRRLGERTSVGHLAFFFSATMIVLAIVTTRFYWALLFGPLTATYAATALRAAPWERIEPLVIDLRDPAAPTDEGDDGSALGVSARALPSVQPTDLELRGPDHASPRDDRRVFERE